MTENIENLTAADVERRIAQLALRFPSPDFGPMLDAMLKIVERAVDDDIVKLRDEHLVLGLQLAADNPCSYPLLKALCRLAAARIGALEDELKDFRALKSWRDGD